MENQELDYSDAKFDPQWFIKLSRLAKFYIDVFGELESE
jgi:hypothetical protein